MIQREPKKLVYQDQGLLDQVEIVWTQYKVPHVKANNYASLGFGYGYAHAQDRLCEIVGQVITLRGERSKYYGAEQESTIGFLKTTNLNSDLMCRIKMPDQWVQEALTDLDQRTQDYIKGYAQGLNFFSEGLSVEDRNALFTNEPFITFDQADVIRSTMRFGIMKELIEIGPHIVSSCVSDDMVCLGSKLKTPHSKPIVEEGGFGSNAWAYGGDVVPGNSAILLANPHSAWKRQPHQLRIYMHQYHLTIPGELDVAGASFLGFPLPMTGYNADVSWTILDAASVIPFVFQKMDLEILDEQVSYRMDGKSIPLSLTTIPIESVDNSGTISLKHYRFLKSELGVLYNISGQAGKPDGWYAITNPGEANAKGLDQFLHAAHATSTREFVNAIEDNRGILSQLVVADKQGDTAYVVAGNVPPINDDVMAAARLKNAEAGFNVLDGSKRINSFREQNGKPLLAAKDFYPNVFSRGIIHNANNSYKYTEYGKVQADYPSVFGMHQLTHKKRNPVNLKYDPRLIMSSRRMKEVLAVKTVTPESVLEVLFDNRNYAAETFLEDILALKTEPNSAHLIDFFEVLAKWDKKNNSHSKGALLFHHFWSKVVQRGLVTTSPCGNPELGSELLISVDTIPIFIEVIEDTLAELASLGLDLDLEWGKVLYEKQDNQSIALHGGSYEQGILNGEMPAPITADGFPYILFGSAYIQLTHWQKGQLVANVLLSHGQRDNVPCSDRIRQLKMFSNKQLYPIPFSQDALESADWVDALRISKNA